MGCGGSKVDEPAPAAAPPAQKTGGYKPPPPPSPEELERKRLEAETEERWKAVARNQSPEPFPKPSFTPGGAEEEYKEYMRKKFEYEQWENSIILLGRKLRREAEAAGSA